MAGLAGSIVETKQAVEDAERRIEAAEASKILEEAFLMQELSGITAEAARGVGIIRGAAGVRGFKSTSGSALARSAELIRGGRRESESAIQASVLRRHGLAQEQVSARSAGNAALASGVIKGVGEFAKLAAGGVGGGAIGSI